MKKKITRRYEPTKEQVERVTAFLKGEVTSRELAYQVNMSPQGVINLTCSLCRQWVQEGKLKFK